MKLIYGMIIGAALLALSASPPARAAGAGPGRTFSDCKRCPQMVVVPAGQYLMGSPPGEKYRSTEDQHPVTIAKPFAVGKFEITFEQWGACEKAGGCGSVSTDEGWGRGKRPVINVNWHDAETYAAWLARTTGRAYRLLTEAEWEYAARAGAATPFSFGATIASSPANFDATTASEFNPKGTARGKTVPVGQFPANAFGLHDMHGNAWEWTADCWHDEYTGAPADGSAWVEPGCGGRVLRGGSWEDSVSDIRLAARVASAEWDGTYGDGFRVALDLP